MWLVVAWTCCRIESVSPIVHSQKKQIKSSCYFKTSNFRNGIKEIFKVSPRRKSRKLSKRSSLLSGCSSGHGIYDPALVRLLSPEEQSKVIESRWVIGPISGVLKVRFVGKGFAQVIDKTSKYAHTPQATTFKLILMRIRSTNGILRFQMLLQHFSTLRWMSQKHSFMSPHEIQYLEPTVWKLRRQLYGLRDSPRSWQIHLTQVLLKDGSCSNEVRSCVHS